MLLLGVGVETSSKHSLHFDKGSNTRDEPVARDAADHVGGRHPNTHSQGLSRSIRMSREDAAAKIHHGNKNCNKKNLTDFNTDVGA